MKNLSKRLLTIASFVKEGSFIADIGSDHCLLPIFLCKEGKISGAFAVDNKPGPYERMVLAINSSGFKEIISASLSSGIEKLDPRADTVILAGMGGILISEILLNHKENLKNVKNIIVDAHTDMHEVYKALSSLGYALKDSRFLLDNEKPYDVMLWEKASEKVTYSDKEMKYGLFNLSKPNDDWRKYYSHRIEINKKLISMLPKGNEKIALLEKEDNEIEEILNTL